MRSSSDELREQIAACEDSVREPGKQLFSQARYEIDRVLGEGGFGVTCLAHEISSANMRRPVVLKFVKDSLDVQRLSRFFNEVELCVLFNHPNLVPIYRLETEVITIPRPKIAGLPSRPLQHTVYYAVMQYIDGWNLRQIVNRLRSLNIALNYDIAMFIIGKIARGLHYVHEYRDDKGTHLGLVHRDVSPENILFDRFGRIKVADFGITSAGKLAPGERSHPGKLLYCSPEQLDGKPLDARSDIYNVGLLMYLLFTDVDRFGAEVKARGGRDRVRRKMTRSPLPDLTRIPERLRQICDACLREDPALRYQNCEDLGTDIDIHFKQTQKVVTSEQLESFLRDLFTDNPEFVSRRFIPLTGSTQLTQPGFDPAVAEAHAEPMEPMPTVKLESSDGPDSQSP